MPNWCRTYVSVQDAPESIERLKKALEEATSKDYLNEPYSFGKYWLGNLLIYTGMSVDEATYGDIRCRGTIDDWDVPEPDRLTMWVDSAWTPQLGAVVKFLEYLGLDPKITFTAEEFGCDLYCSNDPDDIDTYYMYCESTVDIDHYNIKAEDIRYYLKEAYGDHPEIDTLPIEKLIGWAEYEFDDLTIHKCEESDITEWI